jgi:hypothetical protein
VQILIDRIDVQVEAPRTPEAKSAPGPRDPLSLDDYLGRRGLP